tara:strand:+ start:3202 stop:3510 length:309 start_codon:yes stop_codon:yes gene_type:complete
MMTKELKKTIPVLYAQEDNGEDATVHAHYFNPYGRGEWWVLEYDGEDTFFGYVDLGFPELGYFYLSELENARIDFMGYPMALERDLHFTTTTLGAIKAEVKA